MGMTLAEASKLSNDVLLKGVIETIITESQLLSKLPFISIVGNGLTYNQESSLGTVNFYQTEENWVESTPTFTQQTATLTILGGDADLDEFTRTTRSNIQNVQAIIVEEKSKAVARTYEDTAVYGDVTANPKAFNGLHKLVASGQQIHAGSGTTPAAGTITGLRNLCDLVLPGRPDVLLMSRKIRNRLSGFAGAAQSPVQFTLDGFGRRVTTFDDIPIIVSDWIVQTEAISGGAYSAKTGGTATSVFALKFGEKAVSGLQNGGVNVKNLGDLETKDATRTRIKWYCSLACFGTLALARYDGITDAAFTA